jgi:carboxypeptidase Taq
LESEGYQAWLQARKENDFSLFAPKLRDLVQLTREISEAVDPSVSHYDSALDQFEKGMTSARIDEIFAPLRTALPKLLADLKAAPSPPDDAWLQGEWDVDTQAKLCATLAQDMGFAEPSGRLDVSVHPFTCSTHPSDVRMTTRFKPHDVMEGTETSS